MSNIFRRSGGGSDSEVPYKPPPSVGHELGVMFGFIGFMIVCSAVYAIVWNIGNKRSRQREQDRIAKLRAAGHLKDEKVAAQSPHAEG